MRAAVLNLKNQTGWNTSSTNSRSGGREGGEGSRSSRKTNNNNNRQQQLQYQTTPSEEDVQPRPSANATSAAAYAAAAHPSTGPLHDDAVGDALSSSPCGSPLSPSRPFGGRWNSSPTTLSSPSAIGVAATTTTETANKRTGDGTKHNNSVVNDADFLIPQCQKQSDAAGATEASAATSSSSATSEVSSSYSSTTSTPSTRPCININDTNITTTATLEIEPCKNNNNTNIQLTSFGQQKQQQPQSPPPPVSQPQSETLEQPNPVKTQSIHNNNNNKSSSKFFGGSRGIDVADNNSYPPSSLDARVLELEETVQRLMGLLQQQQQQQMIAPSLVVQQQQQHTVEAAAALPLSRRRLESHANLNSTATGNVPNTPEDCSFSRGQELHLVSDEDTINNIANNLPWNRHYYYTDEDDDDEHNRGKSRTNNDDDDEDDNHSTPHLESPAPSFSSKRTISLAKQGYSHHRRAITNHHSRTAASVEENGNGSHQRGAVPELNWPYLCQQQQDGEVTSLDDTVDDGDNSITSTTTPPMKNRRNLSLKILFEGDSNAYQHSSAPILASMTPAESQWLLPQIASYCRLKEGEQPEIGNTSNDHMHLNNGNDIHSVTTASSPPTDSILKQLFQPQKDPQTKKSDDSIGGASNNDDDDTVSQLLGKLDNDSSSNISIQSRRNRRLRANSVAAAAEQRQRSQSITDEVNVLRKKVRTKWLDYLNSVQEAAPDVDVQMEEFIQVPAAVERIMGYGFFICVDSFLYMCTVLPIRCVWSCLLLIIQVLYKLSGWISPKHHRNGRQKPCRDVHFEFHRRHLYQLIQVFILFIICRYVLMPISIGKLYHWIRGQAMIKLYVIIAMVELCDRLLSSLGQDCLDSMYWNTVSRPRSSRFLVSVLVVLVYAALHTIILFIHMATLNVAMNSADQALLTLLISGNYAEIKSTVFKKYNKAALFKITATDICERFKLALFLSLVLLLNVCQGMDQRQFLGYIRICFLIWCAELAADWVKHSFISKFNFMPARVYPEYALLLAGDVTGIGHEGMSLDHSHAVVKRIGFAQIPLICVTFRMLKEASKYARNQSFVASHSNYNSLLWRLLITMPLKALVSPSRRVVVYVGVWVMLLILKLCLGRLLQRISLEKLYAAPEYSQLTPIFNNTKNQQSQPQNHQQKKAQ